MSVPIHMKIEIIERSWFKRRLPKQEPKAVLVELVNYRQEDNHFCTMIVTFDDGNVKQLIGRVIQNKIKGHWTVDGMEVAVLVHNCPVV